MRYKNLIGFVWVAVFMSLFTSCLKDINNVYNPGTTAAVVRQHGDSALMMANTRFGWIYSTKLSSYSEGKCLLVSFDYDPSLPENTGAEQKGYYTVTIQGETAVNQQNAESPLTDTHKLLTNEQPILAVNPNDSVLYVKLEDYLFLPSACWTTKDRALNWQLTYDRLNNQLLKIGNQFIPYIYGLPLRPESRRTRQRRLSRLSMPLIWRILSRICENKVDATRICMFGFIISIKLIRKIVQFTWGVTDPLLIN